MKIIKIGAFWCAGCLVMRSRWEELEKELDLNTKYLDYDNDQEEVLKYNIGKKLPVFIFLDDNNNELARLVGEVSKEKIKEVIFAHKDS